MDELLPSGRRQSRAWDLLSAIVAGESPRESLRVAIVAAHPDDEIASAGALLRRLNLNSGELHALHVTDGAPPNGLDARAHGFSSVAGYRRARRRELLRALHEAQIRCARLDTANIPDQGAAYSLVELVRTIARFLEDYPVDIVLSHSFEGGHPDHDASAFAVHAATTLLKRDVRPLVVEFTSYHAERGQVRFGTFRDGPVSKNLVLLPTQSEQAIQQRARDCFTTQLSVLAPFPLAAERFRVAPIYAFGRSPHCGKLLYEHFDWGLDGVGWQRLAGDALRSLGFRPDECF